MRKIWTQLGLKPWEYEIARLAEINGNEHEAKNKVVMDWMRAGDFDPLLWMIKKEGILRGPALGLLAQMLATGRLRVKKGRGRPQDPETAAKDQFAAATYEDCRNDPELKDVRSDDLFRSVGSISSVGEESVRHALTTKRKGKPRR